jgi:hypothetical protein
VLVVRAGIICALSPSIAESSFTPLSVPVALDACFSNSELLLTRINCEFVNGRVAEFAATVPGDAKIKELSLNQYLRTTSRPGCGKALSSADDHFTNILVLLLATSSHGSETK